MNGKLLTEHQFRCTALSKFKTGVRALLVAEELKVQKCNAVHRFEGVPVLTRASTIESLSAEKCCRFGMVGTQMKVTGSVLPTGSGACVCLLPLITANCARYFFIVKTG